MKKQQSGSKTSNYLRNFSKIKLKFDPLTAKKKLTIVQRLSKLNIYKPSELKLYHDALCFIRAYPDNSKLAIITEKELKAFAHRIENYKQQTRDRYGHKLADTGMVDTTTIHPYSYDLMLQLLGWHPDTLDVEWETNEVSLTNNLFNILPLLVSWQENDTLENEEPFDAQKWLNAASGDGKQGLLKTVANFLSKSGLPLPALRHFFEELELDMTWKLGNSLASRTLKRLPSGTKFYQSGPLRRRTNNLLNELTKPATSLRRLSKKEGQDYVRNINEVLATRNRELFPLTCANPAEVYINQPGRGLSIIVFGQKAEERLPLESNFGALLIRNGMPIGYGIAATLFDRVEIAINIFPIFRSGESSYVIEQFFRIFYHHFGSRVFLVRSTQMGDGEDEALYSGAFWFYYKLGFRAVNLRIRKLAEREQILIKSRSNYRTPIKTMKRLAKTDVFLHTDQNQSDNWKELSLVNLGYAVTDHFATVYKGDRELGISRTASRVARLLGIKNLSQWTKNELYGLSRLAPMVVKLSGTDRWTKAEKSALADVIRSKGSVQERKFVLLSNKHQKFRDAVEELAKR